MAYKSLKGLRKKLQREELSKQGYAVINHRYNQYDSNAMLIFCMNRLMKHEDKSLSLVFNNITTELYNYKFTARVKHNDDVSNIIDEKSVCLSHGNPMPQALHCPHCHQVIEEPGNSNQ